MFQCKIDEIFKDLPNVFGTADDILVVGHNSDGKDHDETLWQVLQICRHVNLKLKDKCYFRCMTVPFFGEIISRLGVQPHPQKLTVLTNMPPPKPKKKLQAFTGIINPLSKFSSRTVEVCESLRKLISAKAEWTWNATYQKVFEETKEIIKEDACMKFYDKTKLLCIETEMSGGRSGAALLQTRDNINCQQRWSTR